MLSISWPAATLSVSEFESSGSIGEKIVQIYQPAISQLRTLPSFPNLSVAAPSTYRSQDQLKHLCIDA